MYPNIYSYDSVVKFLIFSFAVLVYVFFSLGLYTIAKRRGLRNYGLAWVPVANYWILGSVADQYDNAHTGKNLKLRKHLLWLSITSIILYFVMNSIIYNNINTYIYTPYILILYFYMFILFPFVFALLIFEYIALYKLYRSCSPDNAVVLLVFSITFSVIIPFVLFSMRKSDKGMPVLPPAQEKQT